jgi:hypothetical protein
MVSYREQMKLRKQEQADADAERLKLVFAISLTYVLINIAPMFLPHKIFTQPRTQALSTTLLTLVG